MLALLLAVAHAGGVYQQQPIAGHPVFDLRIGVDSTARGQHPYLCAEVYPARIFSIEACGTGSGILHQGTGADMMHLRARGTVLHRSIQRLGLDWVVGAGIAEVQRTTDAPGFRFGAQEAGAVEAAGPEVSTSVKGRLFLDKGGRTYATGDLNLGAAIIPGAPEVMGTETPLVPFTTLTIGLGF